MGEPISVILPMHRWHDHAQGAIESVLAQTHGDFECLLVFNGSDEELLSKQNELESWDERIRVLHTPKQGIAHALNFGIGHAGHELIARMDDDDWSYPDRFAAQVKYMDLHPAIAGCGTGAAFVDQHDQIQEVVMPPISVEQARWKIMVWNPFVHGSMMLRKSCVFQAGGYDESLDRAQDYDLWIRLVDVGLGGVPEVLYRHRLGENGHSGLNDSQSRVTAQRLLGLWEGLIEQEIEGEQTAMAKVARGDASGRVELEALMEAVGPTRTLLQAWMWSNAVCPNLPTDTPLRFRRMLGAARLLKSMGIERVWVWGAGDLGRFVLALRALLGVEIAGVLDDHRAGQVVGEYAVYSPSAIDKAPNTGVVIASELYEDQIWERSRSLRERGVRVFRFSDGDEQVGHGEPAAVGGAV
tara:strand:- start:248197 stop:249432 length:1236 start_codon:yes stop_codon:yes gene_type:complete